MMEVRVLDGDSSYSGPCPLSTGFPDGCEIAAGRSAPQGVGQKPRRLDDLGKVDSGLDSQALEHIDEVFGCQIPRGSGRVGAASEATGRGIVGGNPAFQPRVNVREARAARVV